jgi:hypothetical protein
MSLWLCFDLPSIAFFAIYRAMKEPSKGAAIQFSYSPQKKCVYLTAARQAVHFHY